MLFVRKMNTWFDCAQYYAVCINIVYSNVTNVNSSYLCYDYVLEGLYYDYVENVRYVIFTHLVPICNYVLSLL